MRAIDPALRRVYDLRGVVGQTLDEGAPLAGEMERPHARRRDGAATSSSATAGTTPTRPDARASTARAADYFPVQRGGRFSTNAATPSRKSALP
jgi:hypothetical protein